MNCIIGKMKWFVVAVLVILVAGMTMLGVLGFNNAVDHSKSYEVSVSVDQSIDKSKEVLKDASEKYLAEKGVSYSVQVMDDGAIILYKVGADVTEKVSGLEKAINDALALNAETQGILAEVVVDEVLGDQTLQDGPLLLSAGIALVAIFIYLLITERTIASATATVCSAVLTFLVFLSLMAITRLPALPFVEIVSAIAIIISAVLSTSTVVKYREEIKNATTKVDFIEVAKKVLKTETSKYLFALITIGVAGVALAAFFTQYLLIVGAQIIFAGIAVLLSLFVPPLVWTAIKSAKK